MNGVWVGFFSKLFFATSTDIGFDRLPWSTLVVIKQLRQFVRKKSGPEWGDPFMVSVSPTGHIHLQDGDSLSTVLMKGEKNQTCIQRLTIFWDI